MTRRETHFEQVALKVVLRIANLDGVPEFQYPQWQVPLHQAQMETYLAKLQERVLQAEAAIFERLQELARSNDGHEESEEIANATRELLRIKSEKLKWPDPNASLTAR